MVSVVVNFQWLATEHLIFKAVVSYPKLLEPSMHSIYVPYQFWAKCALDVASFLHCFITHFEPK